MNIIENDDIVNERSKSYQNSFVTDPLNCDCDLVHRLSLFVALFTVWSVS